LLASTGLREPLGWLTKVYFIAQAVGQLLPTTAGVDAVRIVEHTRRRRADLGEAAAAVLIDRLVGAATTLVIGGCSLAALSSMHGGVGSYLWAELALAAFLVTVVLALFSRRVGSMLGNAGRLAAAVRLERPARSIYRALHRYRGRAWTLATAGGLSLVIQLGRAAAIWLCAIAVGIRVGPIAFVLLGSLLALAMMIPITVNGVGVREAFFVVFLAQFGVEADAAFAAGFLFFSLTILATIPGAGLLVARYLRRILRARGLRREEPLAHATEHGNEAPRDPLAASRARRSSAGYDHGSVS
jgi:uncharacterized protein (TIRG00374 family)